MLCGCTATIGNPSSSGSNPSVSPYLSSALSKGGPQRIDVALGQPILVENLSGLRQFAGKDINFNDFSGLLGYSTEVGYVMVISGIVATDALDAQAGEILLIPAYGTQPSVERYDAQYFADSKYAEKVSGLKRLSQALDEVVAKQRSGIFWGRLRRTAFNVTAPGSADHELARRSVVGSDIVHDIRFSGISDADQIEEVTVEKFRQAMVAGDEKVVAALLSPAVFGETDIRGGASKAREMLAEHIINKENWKTVLANGRFQRTQVPNVWSMKTSHGRVFLKTEPVNDFTYVNDIYREKRR
ncbi:MAG: hypothetical protein CSA60_03885 [Neptuniibacter caesariensis]|uniref:Uncharacterized protein n=1 Tax=Neptuniibacter caesariensis TaxID=207954 RepID=A0A2G6JKU0_NEPCE|nr:MAG: hypothetical protein CSA60_03885 [Neptuniibacter caesariensis]